MPALTYQEFAERKYIGELDGLRCISILLVLAVHSHVQSLGFLNGYNGVTIFFVISGFLITTLLLREEAKSGRVSLKSFYIRRAFRIFPLYYLALALTTVAVVAGFGQAPEEYWGRFIYFMTYTNEFASPGTFGHSWSLAIEEKFYFVWPILAFAIPALWRFRPQLALVALAVTSVVGLLLGDSGYLGIYAPIIAGCVVAVLMYDRKMYETIRRCMTPLVGSALLAVALTVLLLSTSKGHTQVAFGLAFAVALPVLLIGPEGARSWLRWKPLRFVGQRAYAIYLFHPLVGSAVDLVVPSSGLGAVVHLILMFLISLAVADVLFRTFERPMIKMGHRLAHRDERVLAGGAGAPPSKTTI